MPRPPSIPLKVPTQPTLAPGRGALDEGETPWNLPRGDADIRSPVPSHLACRHDSGEAVRRIHGEVHHDCARSPLPLLRCRHDHLPRVLSPGGWQDTDSRRTRAAAAVVLVCRCRGELAMSSSLRRWRQSVGSDSGGRQGGSGSGAADLGMPTRPEVCANLQVAEHTQKDGVRAGNYRSPE